MPTQNDIVDTRDVFLRPARVVGRYDDDEQYLDVQFRLLREDLVRPLREGIDGYRKGGLKQTDLFVYRDVRVLKPVMNKYTGDMLNSVQIPVRKLARLPTSRGRSLSFKLNPNLKVEKWADQIPFSEGKMHRIFGCESTFTPINGSEWSSERFLNRGCICANNLSTSCRNRMLVLTCGKVRNAERCCTLPTSVLRTLPLQYGAEYCSVPS